MRFGLAPHSGTFLLDAGAAKQRADKSSANAEPKASLLDELDEVNVPERIGANTVWMTWRGFCMQDSWYYPVDSVLQKP